MSKLIILILIAIVILETYYLYPYLYQYSYPYPYPYSYDQYDFILICAVGRSGSTTLQRIINTIPNTDIHGENYNGLTYLMNYQENIDVLKNSISKYDSYKNSKPCWYNFFDYDVMSLLIKRLIIEFLKNGRENSTTLGFKEIRYTPDNIKFLKQFKKIFPKTKVILHIKIDTISQSKSSWFLDDFESKNKIDILNSFYIKYNLENPDFTYLSTFEDMFDMTKLKQLFKFLNKEYYFNENKIKEILSNSQE